MGSALSQLVNHCQATAISWLAIPLPGLMAIAVGGDPQGCPVSSHRCHQAVADGSVAAQVAGRGGSEQPGSCQGLSLVGSSAWLAVSTLGVRSLAEAL